MSCSLRGINRNLLEVVGARTRFSEDGEATLIGFISENGIVAVAEGFAFA